MKYTRTAQYWLKSHTNFVDFEEPRLKAYIEIDRPTVTSHCCWTSLPKAQTFVKIVINIHVCHIIYITTFTSRNIMDLLSLQLSYLEIHVRSFYLKQHCVISHITFLIQIFKQDDNLFWYNSTKMCPVQNDRFLICRQWVWFISLSLSFSNTYLKWFKIVQSPVFKH